MADAPAAGLPVPGLVVGPWIPRPAVPSPMVAPPVAGVSALPDPGLVLRAVAIERERAQLAGEQWAGLADRRDALAASAERAARSEWRKTAILVGCVASGGVLLGAFIGWDRR